MDIDQQIGKLPEEKKPTFEELLDDTLYSKSFLFGEHREIYSDSQMANIREQTYHLFFDKDNLGEIPSPYN